MAETDKKSTQSARFFEDDMGNLSSMRLMCVIALVASIGFGLITTLHPAASQNDNGLYITFAFLLGAFAPKALQKVVEANISKTGS